MQMANPYRFSKNERLALIKINNLYQNKLMLEDWPQAMTIKKMRNLFSASQQEIINKLLQIDAKEYGYTGKKMGIESVPSLVTIDGQTYRHDSETIICKPVYLPMQVYEAYTKMNSALFNTTGRKVIVYSGYRSPAYQMMLIIHYLVVNYNFNLKKVLSRVLMPDYSQHCSGSRTALDLSTKDGALHQTHNFKEDQRRFKESVEYEWLRVNARFFKFYESYGPKNNLGIDYEPWHWQYNAID